MVSSCSSGGASGSDLGSAESDSAVAVTHSDTYIEFDDIEPDIIEAITPRDDVDSEANDSHSGLPDVGPVTTCIQESGGCEADADCCDGLACNLDGQCFEHCEPGQYGCGLCIPDGEYCGDDKYGCCNAEYCNYLTGYCDDKSGCTGIEQPCTSDTECCIGRCHNIYGVCVDFACLDVEEPCTDDSECCNEKCDEARGVCGDTLDCSGYEGECTSDGGCCSPYLCNSYGTCGSRPLGWSCQSRRDCDATTGTPNSDITCRDGICAPTACTPNYLSCYHDYECCSLNCDSNLNECRP